MDAGVQSPSAPQTELLSPLLHTKPSSHANVATLLYVVPVTVSRTLPPAEAGCPQSTTEAPARTGFNHVALARLPSVGFTFTGGFISAWVEGLFSTLDSISQLAAAFKAARKVRALSSVPAETCDSALIHICTGTVTQGRHHFKVLFESLKPIKELLRASSSGNSPSQWVPSFGMKTAMLLDGL